MITMKLTKPLPAVVTKDITAKDIEEGPCKITPGMSPEDIRYCLQLNALSGSIKYFYERGIHVLVKPSREGYNLQLKDAEAGKSRAHCE
jgi:hypothetical protein